MHDCARNLPFSQTNGVDASLSRAGVIARFLRSELPASVGQVLTLHARLPTREAKSPYILRPRGQANHARARPLIGQLRAAIRQSSPDGARSDSIPRLFELYVSLSLLFRGTIRSRNTNTGCLKLLEDYIRLHIPLRCDGQSVSLHTPEPVKSGRRAPFNLGISSKFP